MGLDVTAYSNIEKLDCVYDACGDPIDPETREKITNAVRIYVNDDFSERALDIEDGATYQYGDSFDFRAGPYSVYNAWREELARIADYPAKLATLLGRKEMRHDKGAFDAAGGPFWELIYFSDCHGTIGSSVSTKLANDFAEYQSIADSHEAEYFREQYAKWRKAFEMAAGFGAVDFH